MSVQAFRAPRLKDRQVIDILKEIATEMGIPNPMLAFTPFDGANGSRISFNGFEQNSLLQTVLELNESSIQHFRLESATNQLLSINRKGTSLFDDVTLNWDQSRTVLNEIQFVKLVAVTKSKFKELKINEAFTGFPNEEINKYYEAQAASTSKLQSINEELLYGIHKRQIELDKNYQKKLEELEAKLVDRKKTLQEEYDQKELTLKQKEEAFQKKESEFETSESKYSRRKLRQDMLKRLAELSEKFKLTQDTRRLRWPIFGGLIVIIAFFGTLTVYSFSQTVDILQSLGSKPETINWYVLSVLTIKQLAFASVMVGGAWYFIKWNDRWFRQHADAEFNFKQLELDINRASWVFEMALEWKDEKNTELPPELLDRLTKNLFNDVSQKEKEIETPSDIASLLIGSASNVKFNAGNGTEVQLDRKGISNALKG